MPEIAWVKNGFRPIYKKREIRRGRNQGKFEVTYRANGNVMRRKLISKSDLKMGEDFNNDLRGKKARVQGYRRSSACESGRVRRIE